MEIRILAIGKIKDPALTTLIHQYVKKITPWMKVSIQELPEVTFKTESPSTIAKSLRQEAEMLLDYFPQSYNIVLAIEGSSYSSPAFSELLQQVFSHSQYKYCNLIIGSSHGVDASVKQQAHALVSFSALTFPHQLMRVIVCEQVYRALTLMKNTKYHK